MRVSHMRLQLSHPRRQISYYCVDIATLQLMSTFSLLYWEEMGHTNASRADPVVENGSTTDDACTRADNTELKQYSPLATTSTSRDELAAVPQRREARRFSKLLHVCSSSWTAEILGALLGVASIAAMAAVLLAMDGKPQAEWDVRIQPNSLISIFSTISSCAFMSAVTQCISQSKWLHFQRGGRVIDLQRFDQASRGAWGSLQFLGLLGFRNTIAIVGSLITIASLAIGPFTQQIIEFPVKTRSLGTSSALASAARGEGMVSGLYTNGFGNGLDAESAPDCECSNLARCDRDVEEPELIIFFQTKGKKLSRESSELYIWGCLGSYPASHTPAQLETAHTQSSTHWGSVALVST